MFATPCALCALWPPHMLNPIGSIVQGRVGGFDSFRFSGCTRPRCRRACGEQSTRRRAGKAHAEKGNYLRENAVRETFSFDVRWVCMPGVSLNNPPGKWRSLSNTARLAQNRCDLKLNNCIKWDTKIPVTSSPPCAGPLPGQTRCAYNIH